jgi:hypothetical protein
VSLALAAVLFAVAPTAPPYVIESVRVRYTHFAQSGLGYQSAAGPPGLPGSEWARIEQPQAEVTARLGDRVVQRIWVPVDAVTAASPDHSRYGQPYDFVDTVTTASRSTATGTLDTLTSYRADRATDVFVRAAFHRGAVRIVDPRQARRAVRRGQHRRGRQPQPDRRLVRPLRPGRGASTPRRRRQPQPRRRCCRPRRWPTSATAARCSGRADQRVVASCRPTARQRVCPTRGCATR